jgi:hypothetical protein
LSKNLKSDYTLSRQPTTNVNGWRQVKSPARRAVFILALVLLCAKAGSAIPLREYSEHVKKAIGALDLIHSTELQPPSSRDTFVAINLRAARTALPRIETVEWNGTSFVVDNSWLDEQLKELENVAASESERTPVLDRILERLQSLAERLAEIDKAVASSGKEEMKERLTSTLNRPEYVRTVKEESALIRVTRQLVKWLASLFPKRRSLGPGRGRLASIVAQILVVGVALAALAYALRTFAPRLLSGRKGKRAGKPQARVILGERLEPDQSAADLLAEAEAMARAGDLRGAIRRGYIALLIELADRKIISLAQHKTNRDYLGAVREIQRLHQNMETLTNNFEQHWYGLVPASENDWVAFRTGYKEAITST